MDSRWLHWPFLPVGLLIVISLIVLSIFAQSLHKQPPLVWAVPGLARVGQHDPPGSSAQAELYAARGECESFQVAVRAPAGKIKIVDVSVTDLGSSNGGLISRSNLELYREHYVPVRKGSKDLGGSNRPLGPGRYADALIPFVDPATQQPIVGAELKAVPFDLEAGKNQVIWADVCIPRETAPGRYDGALTVASDQGNARVPIQVHVWNFELPVKPSLHSAFTIYNDTVSQPPVFYANQRANQEMLLRHKVMPVPVNHESERAFIDELGLNLAHLAFHPFATWGNCNQPPAPSAALLQSQRFAHQPDVPAFLQIADEVSDCRDIFPALREWARNARSAGVLTLVTAIPSKFLLDDGSGTGRSVADIWVLLPKQFESNSADVAAAMHKGDQVWAYTALVQDEYSPKWAIDFDPINYRILGGFLNQSFGLRGLLYWSVNSWAEVTHDPWMSIANAGPHHAFPPGEGMLAYPGKKVGLSSFAPSMRLKWVRDSVEDFEYIEILNRLNRGDWAMQVVKSVAPNWRDWTRDPAALEAARSKLGQEIDRLSSVARSN